MLDKIFYTFESVNVDIYFWWLLSILKSQWPLMKTKGQKPKDAYEWFLVWMWDFIVHQEITEESGDDMGKSRQQFQ